MKTGEIVAGTRMIDGYRNKLGKKLAEKDALILDKMIMSHVTREMTTRLVERDNLLLEKLAALEHEQWVHLMKGIFIFVTDWDDEPDGAEIRNEDLRRWRLRMKKSYAELSEKEKRRPQMFASRVMTIIMKHMAEAGANPVMGEKRE